VTLIFLIVLLSAVNLTFSGILGVYLARIYDEVRRRPSYVIGRTSSGPAPPGGASDESGLASDAPREDLEHVRPL
jgi:hypothetical protein